MSALPPYLKRQRGGNNLVVRLQYPERMWAKVGKKTFEKSMKTPDPDLAEIRAASWIVSFKAQVYRDRQSAPDFDISAFPKRPNYLIKPGETGEIDGMKAYAHEDGALIDLTDKVTGRFVRQLSNRPLEEKNTLHLHDHEAAELSRYANLMDARYHVNVITSPNAKSKLKDRGEAILNHWFLMEAVKHKPRLDAVKALRDLRDVTGATMEAATSKDAIALCIHYQEVDGNSHATAQKKVRWLSTAWKASKKEFGLGDNPFEGNTPKWMPPDGSAPKRKMKPISLDPEDIAKIAKHVDNLEPMLARLIMLVATTGMRPKEACSVIDEENRFGYRCLRIEHGKSEASTRIIPIPDAAVPYLPSKIEGQLFPLAPIGTDKPMNNFMARYSDKVNAFLNLIGITHERKVFYSLRHTAIDNLKDTGCALDLRVAIVGHEDDTHGVAVVHMEYGSRGQIELKHKVMKAIWPGQGDWC